MNRTPISHEEFNALQLHDQSIESLAINFSYSFKDIEIKIGIYNEELKDDEYFMCLFTKVNNVNISELIFGHESSAEIYDHKIMVHENRFMFTMVILTGFSMPGARISFSFENSFFDKV